MVYTKLDVMNYVLDMLQDKFYDMTVHEADGHDLDDCRHAIHVIAQQAEALEKEAATRKKERDEKWQRLFHAIKPYANEWHTAFDLYTLVKDELGDCLNFSCFYARINGCWCIKSEKKGKQERVYRFVPDHYHNEYGEI